MSILAQQSINLDLTVSQAFSSAVDDELRVVRPDMTELGLTRRKLRPELHLPILDNVTLEFPACAKSRFWKNFFDVPDNAANNSSIRIIAKTTDLLANKIANTREGVDEAINALQKSLDPEVLVDHSSIMSSDRVQSFLTLQSKKSSEAYATFAAYLNTLLPSDERLSAYLIAENVIDSDVQTMTGPSIVKADSIRTLTQAQYLTILSLIGVVPDHVQKALNIIDLVEAIARAPEDESLASHPLLSSSYATARAEMMSTSFTPPPAIKAIYEADSFASSVKGVASYSAGENWVPLVLKNGKDAVFGEFLIYCISLKQINPTSPERAREFAMARMIVVRHGLFMDSTEVSKMTVTSTLTVDPSELPEYMSLVRSPEKSYACLYASVISFMKSGHHASAANLDNTLMRLLGALGYNVPIDVCRNMIPTAVYNGPHVASMRLLYGFLLHTNKVDKVTNAIAYRLHPNPPGSAAYCNLELFIDSLYHARFFDVLDRVNEYNSFKMAMKEIRRTMYYVAPYANYLFGKSMPDPTALKAEAAKLAAYASALTTALPSTTLVMSPSLYKLASNEGKNSISAQLYVTAYTAGFTRFFRHTIEAAISKKFGVSRQQIAL